MARKILPFPEERIREGSAPPVCFRHPTRNARRRCYHCRRPICPKCQEHVHGHIFCSMHCARVHRREERWARLLKWNRTALAGPWFRLAFYGAFLGGGLLLAILFLNLHWFVPWPSGNAGVRPSPPVPTLRMELANPDWDSVGSVSIESPVNGASFGENRIDVEGTAPGEAMVGLYVNQSNISVQMTPDGKWRFSEVPLTEKNNVVQVRYFDNRGESSFSKAILVRLETRPAPPPAALSAPSHEAVASRLNLIRARRGGRQVLLTFDGGSSANATPAILDTLRGAGIRATIFLTGEFIRRYPELVRRMSEEGHVIGNHTLSHPHLTTYSFDGRHRTLTGVGREFLQGQLRQTGEAFFRVTGEELRPYWRAPFGEYNREILRWAAEVGYRHVYWSPRLDTLDWVADRRSPLYRRPEQILGRILSQADREQDGIDGGIILMHLGTERPGEQSAHSILGSLISRLRERGYSFTDVQSAWPEEDSAEGADPGPGP